MSTVHRRYVTLIGYQRGFQEILDPIDIAINFQTLQVGS